MDQEVKIVTELEDNEWLQGIVFMADITQQLNPLNIKMQGCNQEGTEFYATIHTFEIKLQQHYVAHFPCLEITT